MKYVALLRGVNVGGRNKVGMKQLAEAMEKDEFQDVSTYINSGNILFDSQENPAKLVEKLEKLIESEFDLKIKVLLRNKNNINKVASAIPADWKNGKEMKCDVMFLWDKYDNKDVLNKLTIKPEVDIVRYVDGVIIWKVDRENAGKSGMMKLPGTELYGHMTIRNCNTLRKIQARMD